MTCYHPIAAWRSQGGVSARSGKTPIVFSASNADLKKPLQLPCGRCIGCKQARAKAWTLRCIHELEYHDCASFITLTYDNNHLYKCKDGSLNKKEFQLFLKRLREEIKKYEDREIMFYHGAEYGEQYLRPHHHAIIFGYDFPDKGLIDGSVDDYISPMLDRCWGNGMCTLSNVSIEAIAYVAGYVLKKQLGPKAKYRYDGLLPEYNTMSKGIGLRWLQDHGEQVYQHDMIVEDGIISKPPKYYDRKYADQNRILEVKENRINSIKPRTKKSLVAQEKAHIKRNKLYSKRTYEASR